MIIMIDDVNVDDEERQPKETVESRLRVRKETIPVQIPETENTLRERLKRRVKGLMKRVNLLRRV